MKYLFTTQQDLKKFEAIFGPTKTNQQVASYGVTSAIVTLRNNNCFDRAKLEEFKLEAQYKPKESSQTRIIRGMLCNKFEAVTNAGEREYWIILGDYFEFEVYKNLRGVYSAPKIVKAYKSYAAARRYVYQDLGLV